MTTLLGLKAECGLTNREIGQALGVSPSTVSDILHGRHIRTINDTTIQQLADALGITFERCWLAMQESADVTYHRSLRPYQRASEIQMQAELVLKLCMPGLGIEVHTPRALGVVDSSMSRLPALELRDPS